ncbi:MAG TPA: alkaline phosphatase PafA [Cyclobacteriaceae bacterium]
MIRIGFSVLLCILMFTAQAQNTVKKPKLVVGIVVDQMRREYLDRFYDRFGEGGFRRMMQEGFDVRNGHYNYYPTVTGPGHASVYTGTTPAVHGIIGNSWYDRKTKKSVNCVEDAAWKPVGNAEGNGDVSPSRLLSTTITDELEMATQRRAKVIGISFKDRAAVLPAGHLADAAYWYDGHSGTFISSTYYISELPQWVQNFNKQGLADKYLNQEWKTLYPIEQYIASGKDDSPYETRWKGKTTSTFPYDLKALRKQNGDLGMIVSTPFGNDLLTEFAKAALTGEKMGLGSETDFLTVSFSSTDAVGHRLGPNALEVEDVYLRLDRNIADLLSFLDRHVGKDNYVVFLTADHGVSNVAQELIDNRVPSGYFNSSEMREGLKKYLAQYFPGKDLIESISGDQIFLNNDLFDTNPRNSGIDLLIASELISRYLMSLDGVVNVYTESVLRNARFDEGGIKGMVVRGHHPRRGGDIVYVLEPGWYSSDSKVGSTHGSPYTYDTHVPILFYGGGIKKGSTVRYHTVTDIAPTLSMILHVKFPSGCTGQPIAELFE